MNDNPIIIFSKHSNVCADLFPYAKRSGIRFQRMCVDSEDVRKKCRVWGIRVVPTILTFVKIGRISQKGSRNGRGVAQAASIVK